MLANKVSGTMMGIWLLIPELLRLGVWDLLCGWVRQPGGRLEPRLGLQLVNEAALCLTRVRQNGSLSQKGLELACGLPFLATDEAVHDLLAARTVAETQDLQVALGQIRLASGHYQGEVLALDAHHLHSSSKRLMPRRRAKPELPATKSSQSAFCLDTGTSQPLCCILASSALSAAQYTPELLDLAARILCPAPRTVLVVADSELLAGNIYRQVKSDTPFDLLTPMPAYTAYRRQLTALPPEAFTHRWAGIATAKTPFSFRDVPGRFTRIVQRSGELQDQFKLRAFLCTRDRDEVEALCSEFPSRWHVEEFFNANQALGWEKAGTMNLNVRYGKMTAALMAQAAIHQLRGRLGEPFSHWDAKHFAKDIFQGLDGDIRVRDNTILVTYYNAAALQPLAERLEHLPDTLAAEGVDPRIPWLYGLKLDFRFR
jgi:hypothetical protein